MKKEKYFLNDREVEIVNEFTYHKEKYSVYYTKNEWCDLAIIEKRRLQKEQETMLYKERVELEKIKKETEKEVVRIQNKAIKALDARLRLNAAFSTDGKLAEGAILIANELKKLIIPEENKL